ncbi:COP9 signalosome complex subunit 1 [Nymphon striatum]|nr:COP9 signalosome complex subunit 1 [Nymphon striatum]
MELPICVNNLTMFKLSINSVEPMQVDAPAVEENENNEEVRYTVDNPTLDLESYAANFSKLGKLYRLMYIADHCPTLSLEGLRMAFAEVQKTFNVSLYQTIHRKLTEAAAISNLPDVTGTSLNIPPIDSTWIEVNSKKAALKLEKLDIDLKNYKSNSIKESIRRGHDDLGDHYLDCGDLCNALKCYSRARDYCTSGRHIVKMCENVIKVSIYLKNWTHVLSYVSKAESTPDYVEMKDANHLITQTTLHSAAGLAELALNKYKNSAKYFLKANFDNCNCPEIISPNNVAMYGGLCALASFDRQELQKFVISSSSFKLFLELEPQLRDIIFQFYESKYASCLKLLENINDNLRLDMYLAPHVTTLYTQIRNRALIQYFSPYLSADMNKMATAFNTTVSGLEDELMILILDGQIQARIDSHNKYFSPYLSADMNKMATAFNTTVSGLEDELMILILDGQIQARIDSHNKILYAKDVDQRSTTFEKSLNMGKEFQWRTKALILRAALIKHKLVVKSPPRDAAEICLPPVNSVMALPSCTLSSS